MTIDMWIKQELVALKETNSGKEATPWEMHTIFTQFTDLRDMGFDKIDVEPVED